MADINATIKTQRLPLLSSTGLGPPSVQTDLNQTSERSSEITEVNGPNDLNDLNASEGKDKIDKESRVEHSPGDTRSSRSGSYDSRSSSGSDSGSYSRSDGSSYSESDSGSFSSSVSRSSSFFSTEDEDKPASLPRMASLPHMPAATDLNVKLAEYKMNVEQDKSKERKVTINEPDQDIIGISKPSRSVIRSKSTVGGDGVGLSGNARLPPLREFGKKSMPPRQASHKKLGDAMDALDAQAKSDAEARGKTYLQKLATYAHAPDRHDMASISSYAIYMGRIREYPTEAQQHLFETFDMIVLDPAKVDESSGILHGYRAKKNAILARIFIGAKVSGDAADDGTGSSGPSLGLGIDIASKFFSGWRAGRTTKTLADYLSSNVIAMKNRGFDGVMISGLQEAVSAHGVRRIGEVLQQALGTLRDKLGSSQKATKDTKMKKSFSLDGLEENSDGDEPGPPGAKKDEDTHTVKHLRSRTNESRISSMILTLDLGDILTAPKALLDLILRLRVEMHGIVITGMTINPTTGRARLPYQLSRVRSFLEELVYEIQERADFRVLALERVDSACGVSQELPKRFFMFCQERNFIGWMSTQKYYEDAAETIPLLPSIGPIGILDLNETQSFFDHYEKVSVAPFGSERYTRLLRALGHRVADAIRSFEFDPKKGDCPSSNELRSFVSKLGRSYMRALETVPAMDGGQQMLWGTEAHAAWLNIAAYAFGHILDIRNEPHKISGVQVLLSQLEKKALERPERTAGGYDTIADDGEDDDEVGSDDEEYSQALKDIEDREKEETKRDVVAYDSALKFLTTIKRGNISDVSQENDSDTGGTTGTRGICGQREFGYRFRITQYSHVLRLVHDLRLAKLLNNLSLPQQREVYIGDTTKNKTVESPDERFVEAVGRIQSVVEDYRSGNVARNKHIYDAFKKDKLGLGCTVVSMMANLLQKLTTDDPGSGYRQVQLWECDAAGLKYLSPVDGREVRYEAVSEFDSGVFHIYLRKRHPNIAEAVVNQYLQSAGLNNTQCVIAEALVRQHSRKVGSWAMLGAGNSNSQDRKEQELNCVSDRILDQVDRSSVRELMRFIQRTRKQELILLRRTDLTVPQRALALRISKEIGAASHQRLLRVSKDNADTAMEVELLSRRLKLPPRTEGLRRDLALLCRHSCWQPAEQSKLQALLLVLGAGMRMFKTRSNADLVVRQILMSYGRDAGLRQLEANVRDVTPFVVREVDLCTVYIEMGGSTDADIHRQFRLPKYDVGTALYRRIRRDMVQDENELKLRRMKAEILSRGRNDKQPLEVEAEEKELEGGPPPNPYDKPISVALSGREYMKKFVDGLFFMFPFFLNLILVLTLRAGVFTSSYMSQAHQNLSGIAIVVAFISVGGMNSCIARIGSYYLYQWSFAVMLVVLSRLLWGGITIMLINSTVTALVAFAFYSWDNVLVYFGYTLLFGLLQLLIACLYNSHKGSIWSSREGWAIIGSILIATVLVLVLLFLAGIPAIAAHFIALGTAVLFLFLVYLYVVHDSSIMYEKVSPSLDSDVMEWYHEVCGGPKAPPQFKIQSEQDAALVEWLRTEKNIDLIDPQIHSPKFLETAKKESVRNLREARAAFAVAVLEARQLSGKRLLRTDPLVRQRASAYDTEESLIHWYVLLTAKDRPFPCTSEWDIILKEATKSMAVKTKTDIVHRGGILWDLVRPYAVHGSFYFALMFVDRILRIFGGSAAAFFVPTTPYELGIGWAQVFLLLAVGALEPLVHRKQKALESCSHLRISRTVGLDKMLKARSSQHRLVYKGEMWLCLRFTILAAFCSTGFLFFFSAFDLNADVLFVYVAACLGYLGFLFGGFNMLFLGGQTATASTAIVKAFLVGLFSGMIAMICTYFFQLDFSAIGLPQTTYVDMSVLGVALGGLTYGFLSVPRPGKHDKMSPTYDFASKAPLMTTAMQTSGQKWIQAPSEPRLGESDSADVEKYKSEMSLLTRKLTDSRQTVGISPDTGVGRITADWIRTCIKTFKSEATKGKENDRGELVRHAFPNGDEQLETCLNRWIRGETELFVVPNRYLLLPGGEDQFFSAVSCTSSEKKKKYQGLSTSASSDAQIGTESAKSLKLRVFAGIDESKPMESQAKNLAEALIHESFEQIFGVCHSYAVAAEMLVNSDYISVPERIKAELHATPDSILMMMDEETDNQVLEATLINLTCNTVDQNWVKLSDNTKTLVVGILEKLNPNFVSPILTSAQLRAHIRLGPKLYRKAFTQLTGDPPKGSFWDRRLALHQLVARISVGIKRLVRSTLQERHVQRSSQYSPINFKPPTWSEWDPYDPKSGREELVSWERLRKDADKQPWSHRAMQRVDNVFRLFCLGVVGDISFPAEHHFSVHASTTDGGIDWAGRFLIRFFVSWIYLIALKMVYVFVWLPLRLFRPHVRILYNQLDSGLNRTRYLKPNSGLIDRVVLQDPETPLTGFLFYDESESGIIEQEEEEEKEQSRSPVKKTVRANEVHVYPGNVQNIPRHCKGRTKWHMYAGGRLHHSYNTKDQKILKTCFYGYPSSTRGQTLRNFFIPVEKRVYKGIIPEESMADDKQLEELVFFDKQGRVTGAELTRIDPRTSIAWRITATYYHPSKTNPADSRASRHVFKVEGPAFEEDNKGSSDLLQPFHTLEVTYHDFTSFVSKVQYKRSESADTLVTKIIYRHIAHPQLRTVAITATGKRRHETPVVVAEDPFHLLSMPPATSIFEEDLVAPLPKQRVTTGLSWVQILLGIGEQRTEDIYTSRYPTRKARTVLWKVWQLGHLEGVYAQLLDERILRNEPVLQKYWRLRDWGAVASARKHIIKNEGSIAPLISFTGSNSSHLILRVPDLLTMGAGGSSHHNGSLAAEAEGSRKRRAKGLTSIFSGIQANLGSGKPASDGSSSDSESEGYSSDGSGSSSSSSGGNDSEFEWGDDSEMLASFSGSLMSQDMTDPLLFSPKNPLMVLGVDSGTWPADGGGVASCRRDVINRLPRARWLEIAEIGSPMKLVQGSYQIEKNVQSLTFVPLWGTDLGGPNQTILSNMPYGKLSAKHWRTTPEAISRYFLPIITQLANSSVLRKRSEVELDHCTQLFVNMYLFFQRYDWNTTWESPLVHEAWRKAWLNLENKRMKEHPDRATDLEAPLERELPTLEDIDFALSLVMHFMMPITVPLPPVPVVHATHHGIQAVIGAVSVVVNGSSLIIWDHGVLWRERLLALAELKSFPLFVRNVLVGITEVCVSVVFHNADIVVPCTSTGNPQWEARLGGHNNNQRTVNMWRKISPVINGMETDRFHVHREDEDQLPTAIMLSHVYDLKDVKNAIRAASVIVNKFKLEQYRLKIYGSLDKDLEYVDDCKAIIASNGLQNNVSLLGLGHAPTVVPHGWIFLNSSKSEGLPLALGEAGLAGLPVVCTDVGGSREVINEKGHTYGGICPARNPDALAREQLNVFAMLGDLPKSAETLAETEARRKFEKEKKENTGQESHSRVTTTLSLDDFAPLKPDGPPLFGRIKSVIDQRRRLGMRFRAYILRAFTMERYLREHEEILWIGAMRSRERRQFQEVFERSIAINDDASALNGEMDIEDESGSNGGASQLTLPHFVRDRATSVLRLGQQRDRKLSQSGQKDRGGLPPRVRTSGPRSSLAVNIKKQRRSSLDPSRGGLM